jgi:type II secretory ATPase GspE/PulE/Tfp pilus assembly ATPase PilB-like protein
MGAEAFLMVSTLRVAVGQRLVRRLADDKQPYTLTKAERDELGEKVNLDTVRKTLIEEGIIKEDATLTVKCMDLSIANLKMALAASTATSTTAPVYDEALNSADPLQSIIDEAKRDMI